MHAQYPAEEQGEESIVIDWDQVTSTPPEPAEQFPEQLHLEILSMGSPERRQARDSRRVEQPRRRRSRWDRDTKGDTREDYQGSRKDKAKPRVVSRGLSPTARQQALRGLGSKEDRATKRPQGQTGKGKDPVKAFPPSKGA